MKIIEHIKKYILSICIILNILLIFIGSYECTIYEISYKTFSDYLIIALIINIIIIGIYLIVRKIKKEKYRIKIYDYLVFTIIIFLIISVIFAIHKYSAIYGFYNRYEGLLSLLYYFSLFFLSSFVDKNKKKIIIYTILLTGVLQTIYAFLQMNQLKIVEISYSKSGDLWGNGLTTNPNFFGTYVLLCLTYSIGLLIENRKLINEIIYVLLVVIFMIGLLVSNATSCAVGLIFILIYITIYCIKKRYIEKIICIIILLSFITGIVNNEKLTTLVKDIVKTNNEVVEITKGNIKDSYGTKRIKIWKETIKIAPKYIIHGVGIDNYAYAFNNKPLNISGRKYDKAHNEYLQILITEGIFTLITYLLLYFLVVIYGIEYTYKNKNIYLILPVIAYMIQAFFNISVIEVAPIYYISLGLLIDRDYKNKNILYSKYIKRIIDIILSLILIILLFPIFIIISILIKLDDNGNIFYKQIRTGKNGKKFKIYKFRTINEKHKVTKIGKLLRNTSLDEIPQLINVIKGEMSLIGPRPWITEYYKRFNEKQKKRVSVRPGIIGLAQVNGRNSITVIKKIEYDLEYIENINFITDIKIFFKSFKILFIKEDESMIENNIKKELKELSKYNKKIER